MSVASQDMMFSIARVSVVQVPDHNRMYACGPNQYVLVLLCAILLPGCCCFMLIVRQRKFYTASASLSFCGSCVEIHENSIFDHIAPFQA